MEKETVIQTIDNIGKIPPQNIRLEEAVLGAIMVDNSCVNTALEKCHEGYFYKPIHQKIYNAVMELHKSGESVDIITVTNKLKQLGVLEEIGGAAYITLLTGSIGSAAHVEFHIAILGQLFAKRELIRISNYVNSKCYDDGEDLSEIMDYQEKETSNILNQIIKRQVIPIENYFGEIMQNIINAGQNQNMYSGIPSGFVKIDHRTNGWQNQDLIIIAGRPGSGKTSFVLSMLRNMSVEHGLPVCLFSLEMSAQAIAKRLVSMETEINSSQLTAGEINKFEMEQIEYGIKKMSTHNFYIDDTGAIGINEVKAKCRKMIQKYKIKLFALDYIGLMSTDKSSKNQNREQEISILSRSFKGLAKELDVPFIVLSQLNRNLELRGNKRPQLSDLRDSGAIEQDADLVVFIHRPELYDDNSENKGIAEIIFAKFRNGEPGETKLLFKNHCMKFSDYSEGDSIPMPTLSNEEIKRRDNVWNND